MHEEKEEGKRERGEGIWRMTEIGRRGYAKKGRRQRALKEEGGGRKSKFAGGATRRPLMRPLSLNPGCARGSRDLYAPRRTCCLLKH